MVRPIFDIPPAPPMPHTFIDHCANLAREQSRRDLEHAIALDATITTIELECALHGRDTAGRNWWHAARLETDIDDVDVRVAKAREVSRAIRYLDLCGLIERPRVDVGVELIRIRHEALA